MYYIITCIIQTRTSIPRPTGACGGRPAHRFLYIYIYKFSKKIKKKKRKKEKRKKKKTKNKTKNKTQGNKAAIDGWALGVSYHIAV